MQLAVVREPTRTNRASPPLPEAAQKFKVLGATVERARGWQCLRHSRCRFEAAAAEISGSTARDADLVLSVRRPA